MFTKSKRYWTERIKKRNKMGFSLVELIVVIAIMAIMTAVLAPSLLSYVERTRAQKDFSAMDEVTNAVFLAMADPYVYDELVRASEQQNVSCYIDTNSEYDHKPNNYSQTKDKDDGKTNYHQYTFTDNARMLDEVKYYFAGNMRGTTITFAPSRSSSKSTYVFASGMINKAFPDKSQSIANLPSLYNSIRSAIGDSVELTSQTYRNSEYTIFVRIGTTGGNEANAQDAMLAYGQFSGTNLSTNQENYYVAFGREVDDPDLGVDPNTTPPTPPKPTLVYGDFNSDGKCDSTDVNALRTYINGVTSDTHTYCDLTAYQVMAADVNGDNNIELADAIMMEQYLSGAITEFPAETQQNVFVQLGDVNLDGNIDAQDVSLIGSNVSEWTDKQRFAGDVNRNGAINSADKIILARYVQGAIDSLG